MNPYIIILLITIIFLQFLVFKWPTYAIIITGLTTFLGQFIFFTNYIPSPLGLSITVPELCFYAVLPALITRLISSPPQKISKKQKNAIIIIILFMFLLLVGVFFSYQKKLALKTWIGLTQWVVWWGMAIFFLNTKHAKIIIRWMMMITTASATILILKTIIAGQIGRIETPGLDPNYFASLILLTIISFTIWQPFKLKKLQYCSLTILLIAGILTGSRTFLVTLLLFIIIFFLFYSNERKTKIVTLLIFLILISGIFIAGSGGKIIDSLRYHRSLLQRKQIYLWSIYNLPKTILHGIGPGNMKQIYNNFIPVTNPVTFSRTAHNTYFQILNAGGVLALVCYISFFIIAVISIKTKFKKLSSKNNKLFYKNLKWQIIFIMIIGLSLNLAYLPFVWVLLSIPFVKNNEK